MCFRMSRVAGVIGILVAALGWEFFLPAIAALVSVEEPAVHCKEFMV